MVRVASPVGVPPTAGVGCRAEASDKAEGRGVSRVPVMRVPRCSMLAVVTIWGADGAVNVEQ